MLLDIIKKGVTDRSVTIRVIDSTDGTPETGVVFNTSGLALWYRRTGGSNTPVTLASLASLSAGHADGGFIHIGDGYYRLDLPDAAFASGATGVDIGGTVPGMVIVGGKVRLTDLDLDDPIRAGLTSLPNVAIGSNGSLPTADASGSVKIQTALKRNQALNNYHFLMTDTTTHSPATGLSVSVTRALDSGSFAAGTLSAVTEVSNGIYRVSLGAGDMNATVVTLRFTATGADDLFVTLITEP